MRLQELYKKAAILALVTIYYNIAEGLVSVWFGSADETISLFGFGLDSFVEVISGIGVWHMVRRLGRGEQPDRDPFERRALRITGISFYILAAGLAATAVISSVQKHRPVTTLWGIIISLLSIVAMQVLIHYKVRVGKALNSPAILADAACTRTCLRLSVILLVTSLAYELTGIGYLDAAGTGFIAALSLLEGKEAFDKSKGLECGCSESCCGATSPQRERRDTR